MDWAVCRSALSPGTMYMEVVSWLMAASRKKTRSEDEKNRISKRVKEKEEEEEGGNKLHPERAL